MMDDGWWMMDGGRWKVDDNIVVTLGVIDNGDGW